MKIKHYVKSYGVFGVFQESVFSYIRADYGYLLGKSLYSVWMQETRTRKTLNKGTFYAVENKRDCLFKNLDRDISRYIWSKKDVFTFFFSIYLLLICYTNKKNKKNALINASWNLMPGSSLKYNLTVNNYSHRTFTQKIMQRNKTQTKVSLLFEVIFIQVYWYDFTKETNFA